MLNPFETVARKLGQDIDPDEFLEMLERAKELHESYTSLFPIGSMTHVEYWIIAFLSGYRHKRKQG